MVPVPSVNRVFDLIQQAKAGASAFATNFFPAPARLEGWIQHHDLFERPAQQVVFFLRRDRGFWRLFFCAANALALERELAGLPLQSQPFVTDLVGPTSSLDALLAPLRKHGFRVHCQLVRLSRSRQDVPAPGEREPTPVVNASSGDAAEVLNLLEAEFDRFADQLPTAYEIEAAIQAGQVAVIRCEGHVAALVFFETQGFTSTVRYWVVGRAFQAKGFGSRLMRHYFAVHPAVRRFTLWVTDTNENALEKYRHYGYTPDGLLDRVLVNPLIPA